MIASALLPAYEALRRVGGLEIAAFAAVQMNPACRPRLLFSHRSAEPGHRAILDWPQGQEPLQLAPNLGEGSGGAIAEAAVSKLR